MLIRLPAQLAGFLLWMGVALGWAEDVPVAPEGDMLCGAKCLYTGLVALDLDPGSYPEFLDQCGEVNPQGLSIGQLAEFAQKYGAQTLAVKTTLENLKIREGRFVCIAHVDGNHFVNLGDVDDSSVWVINPPTDGSVARELFEKRWDGHALLLSKSALLPEENLRQPQRWGWLVAVGGLTMGIAVWLGVQKRRQS